jgi:hypothetical protein
MPQTILTVVADVQPASADMVRALLNALKAQQEVTTGPDEQQYDNLKFAVPALHFMSMTVADDDQYGPVFVLEVNFDGAPGPFWAQLEAAIGPLLRDVLRLCKPPRDERLDLFNAVTAPASRAPLAPLLEALTVVPAVSHQGNRGMDRARILAEGELFLALRREIAATPDLHGSAPADIHRRLRARLISAFPWLDETAPARIGTLESVGDYLRFAAFVVAILLAFFGIGWALTVLAEVLLSAEPAASRDPGFLQCIGLALLGALCVLPPMALRLRWLEQHDQTNDAPASDPTKLRAMGANEDFVAQNHMISIVHLKPGALRMFLAQFVLLALRLYARVAFRSGYLASMRTIHFAHWAVISNGGRLMFHSNFDGSWESYLDDFIEKAHAGLTLAWTHGVGFPATRWLFRGGATEGRKFKAWARHSMSPSQFWFSAYKDFSVNQIERQARLADGLRRPALGDQEARAWAIDL